MNFTRAAFRIQGSTFLLLAVGVECLLLLYRTTLGIDFSDESFYVALPLRFVWGDRPFVDDLTFLQPAGLLVAPLVWCYWQVVGSTAGVVLFTRLAYLLASLAVCLLAYAAFRQTFRRELPKGVAALLALTGALFIPYGLGNFSYNTLGMLHLTAGLLILAFNPLSFSPRNCALIAGGCLGLSACAYPPFAPAALVALLVAYTYRLSLSFKPMPFLLGLAVPPALFAVWIFAQGSQTATQILLLLDSYSPYRATPGEKMIHLAQSFFGASGFSGISKSAAALVYSGLLVIAWNLWSLEKKSRQRYLAIALPSLAAGAAAAWASTNGILAASLGLLPAFWVGLTTLPKRAVWIGGAHVFFLSCLFLGDAFYKEAPYTYLNTRITTGPFAGIQTTSERAAFLERFTQRERNVCGAQSKLLTYHPFVAGYLFSPHKPALRSLWASPHDGVSGHLMRQWTHRAGTKIVKVPSQMEPNPVLDQIIAGAQRSIIGDGFEIHCL